MRELPADLAALDELLSGPGLLEPFVEHWQREAQLSGVSAAEHGRPTLAGRKQGGQPGHPGSHRELVADPDHVVEHWPDACGRCSAPIAAKDRQAAGDPVRHQVTDIVVRVEVTEHWRMRTRCACGCRTLADLPVGVPAGAFGPSVAAAAATLTAARLSRRDGARLIVRSRWPAATPANERTSHARLASLQELPGWPATTP